MTQKAQDSKESNSNSHPTSEKDACAAVSDYFTSKFEYLPPSFGELFQSSPDMQPFLKSMLNLLHLAKDGPLSTESIENIELATRQLIFSQSYLSNMMNNQNSENSAANSPTRPTALNSDQVDQIEINRLRSSYLKLKSNYALLQEESDGYKNKISSLQNQIEVLNEEKKAIKKSLLQQKKESNNEMTQMKEKDSELSEKYQDALTKIKLMNGVIDGLKTQLKMAQDETDESLKRSEKLEAKLTEKKKIIYKLKVDMKKQNILYEQSNTNMNNSARDVTLDSPTSDSNANNNNEIIKLKAQLDSKARDVAESKQIIKEREATIDAHKKRIESQSETILNINKEIDDIQKQNQLLKDLIQENENKLNEKDELLNCRANELINLRDLLMKISTALSNDYNIEKLTDIPDIIEDLLSLQNDQVDQKVNSKSLSFIDGLTRFINTMLMNNKTNFNLLVDPVPILGDRELLVQITNNINRLRETFEETYGTSPEENRMFDSLLSAKEHFSEDSNNCEFASLIIICAANEKLRRLCILQKKQLDEYQRLIPYEKYNDFRKLLNSYEKINTQIFKDKFDDRITLLSTFLDRITSFYHRMKIEVFPALSIDCDLAESPDKIINLFNELNQSYSNKISQLTKENEAKNSKSQESISDSNSFSQTDRSLPLAREDSFQTSLNQAENKINKLETQNKKLEDLVKKLLKKVQSLSAEKDSFKEKFNDIVANQNTQEDNFSTINERFLEVEEQERKTRLENERLQALIEQRQQSFQTRLDTLLQAERDNSAKELARNEKMWQEEKKSLLNKLDAKTAKYNYQRKADRELIEFLEKQIKNHNAGNDSKSNSFENLNSSNGNDENNVFFNNVIKELQKVVHVKGEWTQQKALSGVRKIVSVISKSDNEPKQQNK